MISVFFIALSVWIGFILEDQFDFVERNFWVKTSSAIIVGSMLSTWLVFVMSAFVGFNRLALFAGLLVMSLYIGYARARQIANIEWFKQDVLKDNRIAWPHAAVLIFVMPFFIFGM